MLLPTSHFHMVSNIWSSVSWTTPWSKRCMQACFLHTTVRTLLNVHWTVDGKGLWVTWLNGNRKAKGLNNHMLKIIFSPFNNKKTLCYEDSFGGSALSWQAFRRGNWTISDGHDNSLCLLWGTRSVKGMIRNIIVGGKSQSSLPCLSPKLQPYRTTVSWLSLIKCK